ncbi:imidazole glycerol phosphate synthase subunit HisH [Sinomicrobium soli]|uniref:imidazole glycerol phosphate synthase subunit HisH n=1 Tax=Sinomicrobium sp. N-1-3-6 TaxID=2219864 RepID=UPI000DCB2F5B|nr:imidazole glycerol phosphate synthase subunit HisH [Sinomicrobium sp. N-1-3-6]RAV29103.1 imidazole glycerol phosphate synthase subunit HisH [Sinomicrobium sp. N-1-3-6]
MKNIVIIDYGAGNIQSVKFAVERLGHQAVLTDDAATIKKADKVIFPGVGAAGSAMSKLRATGLDRLIPELEQPVLGICLGMQLMCRHSEEGNTSGLGIFDADVLRFPDSVKVPQIGWNRISGLKSDLFDGIRDGEFMYLVHSYYVPDCPEAVAYTSYGIAYASALKKDNFYGVQFHPEKSSTAGAAVLKNFLETVS